METVIKYSLLFFFYSAAGWLLESVYCSIGEKKLINRGFLTGPLCPIYGVAAVVMTVLIYNPFKDKPLIIFLLGIILCDIVEFITSFIMEKLFAARWWDYTYEFLNINGRICLKHTLYWGVISVIFVRVIHPGVDRMYNKINGEYLVWIFGVIIIIFIIDLINAVIKASDIRKLHRKLDKTISFIMTYFDDAKENVGNKYTMLKDAVEKQSDKVVEFKYQIEDLYNQFEIRFNKLTKKEQRSQKIKSLSNRIFYDNPLFERRTKLKLEKLKNIIDEIKADIYEGEEMQ